MMTNMTTKRQAKANTETPSAKKESNLILKLAQQIIKMLKHSVDAVKAINEDVI